jgi:outer membrane murein-binding lipoprotein Lpp
MKNQIPFVALPLLATLLLSGCRSTDKVAQPSNITLVSALHDVGAGLAALKAAELETVATNAYLRQRYETNDFITGLFPSEVEVTFNVTAGAANSRELCLDLNASVPTVPVSGGASGKVASSSTAARGNQITLKFNSVLFATTTTTTTQTNGTKVAVTTQKLTDAATLTNFWNAISNQGGGVRPNVYNVAAPEKK